MITVRNLSFNFADNNVLSNINLQIDYNEFICILGANGTGKSTLINLLSGQLKANSTALVELNNKAISDYSVDELANVRAYMPQSVELHYQFSCLDVVEMGRLGMRPYLDKNDEFIVKQCMQALSVWHFKDKSYPSLSGGQKQRVQIARVLAQIINDKKQPKLLLLDECTSSLDLKYQHQVFKLLRDYANEYLTVVAIVHDINLAAQYSDRLLMLKQGELHCFDKVNNCLTAKNIHDLFSIDADTIFYKNNNYPTLIHQPA